MSSRVVDRRSSALPTGSRALVIGHRGAPGHRPEHTRSSLLLAIEQGADAIEIDVVPSRDGVLVVRHDRDLASTTDIEQRAGFRRRVRPDRRGRRVDDLDWAELAVLRARERLPRLRPASAEHDGREGLLRLTDALAIAADADVRLVIEIKDAVALAARGLDPAPLLRAAVATAPRLPEIVLESFEKTALLALADLQVPLVYLLGPSGTAADERRRGPSARSYRQELEQPAMLRCFDGLSLPIAHLSPRRVARLHELGFAVWTWTLRPENRFLPRRFRSSPRPSALGDWRVHWSTLFAAGVDGVFADHPDLAVEARDTHLARGGSPVR